MNESEKLLVMTLDQLGCLPKDKQIEALSQIQHEDFGYIIIKVCRNIMQIKNIEMIFPETLSKEMNKRYQECQKVVEFIKNLGYKSDLNINNILFPSMREMQRLLEFTLEIITSVDTGAEFAQGITEKNYTQIKIGKQLNEWHSNLWVIPELNPRLYPKKVGKKNKFTLKLKKSQINDFKQIVAANAEHITDNQKILSQTVTEEITSSPNINFIQEEDNAFLKYAGGDKNHNYLVNKLKIKNNYKPIEKSTNQDFLDCLEARGKAIDFLYHTYKENNFTNNVNIINRKNKNLYGILNLDPATMSTAFSGSSQLGGKGTNDNLISGKGEGNEDEENKNNLYQSKLDNIISNLEEKKKKKNEEIAELNNKLLNIVSNIEKLKDLHKDNADVKGDLQARLDELSMQNKKLLKEIEEQMSAYEQMKKLQKSEIVEADIVQEVQNLEKKYEDLVSGWEEYSTQSKARIDELKTKIDTKKKEYSYKYEQITTLKKEIEEIANKIANKQEHAAFLKEESEKIPVEVNRNNYTNKIAELTKNIKREKNNILNYLNDVKAMDAKIAKINENIKRVDNEFEDKLFQDAKQHSNLKDVYTAFIKLRDGYTTLQKNILDANSLKHKLKELENKVDDYKIKLKSYDYEQLKEQVEFLRSAKQ